MFRVALPHLTTLLSTTLLVVGMFVLCVPEAYAQTQPGPGSPGFVDPPPVTNPNVSTQPGPGSPGFVDPPPVTNPNVSTQPGPGSPGFVDPTTSGGDGSNNTSGDATNDTFVGGSENDTLDDDDEETGDDGDWEFKLKKFIYEMFISVGGMVTWAGGNLLDWTIQELVIDFGKLLTENLGLAVNAIWEIVRDLINIVFIFVLIWIGLRTILNADESNLRRNLSYLIAAALLINFSLFMTKAVVDFTNIAATQIAQAFVVLGADGDGSIYNISQGAFDSGFDIGAVDERVNTNNPGAGPDGSQTEIAAAFMESLQLSSYANSLVVADQSIGFVIAFSFLVFIMMVIAGFVFASGALMLIIRFVSLTLVMMFSPLMFLGWIYPGLRSVSSKWMDIFLRNAFVAPAFIFMLYIALSIIAPGNGQGGGGFGFVNGAVANAAAGDANSFGIFLHFAIVIGFLLAAVKVSSMMSTYGSGAVSAVGFYGANKMRGWGKNLAMRPVNYGKRVGQNAGAAIHRRTPIIGGKSYDKAAKKLKESRARYEAGEATTGDKIRLGYSAVRGAGSLDQREAALKAGAEHQPFGGKSYAQYSSRKKELARAGAQAKTSIDIRNAIKTASDNQTPESMLALEEALGNASSKDIVEIAKSEDGAKQIAGVAGSFPNSTWNKIMESEDVSPANRATLQEGRTKAAIETIRRKEQGVEFEARTFTGGLKHASVDELASLKFESLKENAIHLQSSQMDELRKRFGPEKFRILQDEQIKQFTEKPVAAVVDSRKGVKEIAKLPKHILESYDFVTHCIEKDLLGPNLLDKIATESSANKLIIGDKIQNAYGGDMPDWWTQFTRSNLGRWYTRPDHA